jgi:hypothetical protein
MTSATPAPASMGQAILMDTQALRRDLATVLSLAQATALPLPGEDKSFLETIIGLLQMIVVGVEDNRKSLEALHQRLNDPAIQVTLRRMIED